MTSPLNWMKHTVKELITPSLGLSRDEALLHSLRETLEDLENDKSGDREFVTFVLQETGFSRDEIAGDLDAVMKEWEHLRRSLIQGTDYLQ